ncbi:hypothetical protein OH77DRAFT_1379157, partial [Trametes cingulata]
FQDIWATHRPIVVRNVDVDFQIQWSPDYLAERYGSVTCQVEDCESGSLRNTSVAEFFSIFRIPQSKRTQILKLKDWPPADLLKSTCPQIFDDFIQAIPIPEYTAPTGIYNLAAHFPLNAVAPDLGPKMYCALSSILDDHHHGSTRLHVDLSDAINLLTYASTFPDGSPGHAVWHIFSVDDTERIQQLLRAMVPQPCSQDPIHGQNIYLTPSMLKHFEQSSITPYTILQRRGDAVFVPAGCAHQVSNATDCIKVACDFV